MHIGSSCFISCNRNNLLFGIYTLRGVIINYKLSFLARDHGGGSGGGERRWG